MAKEYLALVSVTRDGQTLDPEELAAIKDVFVGKLHLARLSDSDDDPDRLAFKFEAPPISYAPFIELGASFALYFRSYYASVPITAGLRVIFNEAERRWMDQHGVIYNISFNLQRTIGSGRV